VRGSMRCYTRLIISIEYEFLLRGLIIDRVLGLLRRSGSFIPLIKSNNLYRISVVQFIFIYGRAQNSKIGHKQYGSVDWFDLLHCWLDSWIDSFIHSGLIRFDSYFHSCFIDWLIHGFKHSFYFAWLISIRLYELI
jgi:hypothetical protein